MKKFLGMLAIAGVLVACNNSGDSADATADSIRRADSIRVADSIAAANATPTPAPSVDSPNKMMTDSPATKKMVDSPATK